MKTPESPRAYPTPPDLPSVERHAEVIIPRYIQAPALRDHGLGPRNLFWGVAMLVLALVLLVVALFLTGTTAMLSVATCLLTFTALFVLARLHVFRQRNGGFLALGLVCLLGASVPLMEKAYSSAKHFVATRSAASEPVVALHSAETEPPLLSDFFALPKPQGNGKQVNVLHDTPVTIAGKPFLIKAGEHFPLVAVKGDETTFAARDLQIAVPSRAVEVIDPTALAKGVGASASAHGSAAATAAAPDKSATPTDAELAEITRNAQQEAMRRYPALALKDSLENAAFVSAYRQIKEAGGSGFFDNPEWPLELAELLAKRENWVRGGAPMTTGPAPVLDPPAAEANPAANPPADAPDAGAPGAPVPRPDQDAR